MAYPGVGAGRDGLCIGEARDAVRELDVLGV